MSIFIFIFKLAYLSFSFMKFTFVTKVGSFDHKLLLINIWKKKKKKTFLILKSTIKISSYHVPIDHKFYPIPFWTFRPLLKHGPQAIDLGHKTDMVEKIATNGQTKVKCNELFYRAGHLEGKVLHGKAKGTSSWDW